MYTFAAGLLALAIAAVVVVEERSVATASDGVGASAESGAALLTGATGSDASTRPGSDAVAPHFQRSDEPANDDDLAHPYGG